MDLNRVSMDLIRVSDVLRLLYPHSLNFVDQEHLERGTRLHELMEFWVNNQIYGVEQTEIAPGIQPVVQWIATQDVTFVAAEERVNHKYGYTGKPDVNVIWNGQPWIWDWKFSEQITEQNIMQLTAYHQFEHHKCTFIQCQRDGTIRAIKCKPDPLLWAAFLNGLGALKFRQSRQPKQLTPEQIEHYIQEVREALCQTEI